MHALDNLLAVHYTVFTIFTHLSGHVQLSMPSYRHLGCMCWSQDHLMEGVCEQHLLNRIWNTVSLFQIRQESYLTLCPLRISPQPHH